MSFEIVDLHRQMIELVGIDLVECAHQDLLHLANRVQKVDTAFELVQRTPTVLVLVLQVTLEDVAEEVIVIPRGKGFSWEVPPHDLPHELGTRDYLVVAKH